jgi:hypothetical protein
VVKQQTWPTVHVLEETEEKYEKRARKTGKVREV